MWATTIPRASNRLLVVTFRSVDPQSGYCAKRRSPSKNVMALFSDLEMAVGSRNVSPDWIRSDRSPHYPLLFHLAVSVVFRVDDALGSVSPDHEGAAGEQPCLSCRQIEEKQIATAVGTRKWSQDTTGSEEQ